MLKDLDNYYATKDEPSKSCLLAMRSLILKHDKDITEAWKYKMPFFCYKGKMFCYLWIQKNTNIPYIGIVEGKRIDHPCLIIEGRSRMKIMLIDPDKDIPLKEINKILKQAIGFYKDGAIKI